MHRIIIRFVLPTLLVLFATVVRPGFVRAKEDTVWPHEFDFGACARNSKGADVLAWAPPGKKRIRAILIIIANTDSKHIGEHDAMRKVAAEREMGMVYLRCSEVIDDLSRRRPGRGGTIIQGILNVVAEKTGVAEFRHAPWIPLGKSSMGRFPFWMAWACPERTIACITYHGEAPTWPPAAWANLGGETIPYVCVNGETEWGGTWNRHVRPSLLNYRARKNWLPHQVIVHDVGHGNYLDTHGSPGWGKPFPDHITCIDVWNYLSLFVDKAIQARVPTEVYPTNGPVKLKRLDNAGSFAIDRFAVERLFDTPMHHLESSPAGYVIDPAGDEPEAGYAAVPPAKDYEPPAGVPVVRFQVGVSPSQWLITEGMHFAMKADPMVTLGSLESLRPRPGASVQVDDFKATFRSIDPQYVKRGGGIHIRGLQPRGNLTLLAYTTLDMPEAGHLKVNAPFTQNGRVQVVLNGVPVAHRQIVEVEKGLYPILVVVRLRTQWQSLHASLDVTPPAEVEQAKKAAAELARKAAAAATATDARDDGGEPPPLIQPAAALDESRRRDAFWLFDRELADAWLRLHDVRGVAIRESK